MIAVGIIILSLLVLMLAVGAALAHFVARPAVHTPEEIYDLEQENGFIRDYPQLKKQSYQVETKDGLKLSTIFIPAEKKTEKYVIFSHGYTWNHYGSVKYVHIFHSLGWNCIIYDNRGHGDNPPAVCTMGLRESDDLLQVINDTYRRFGDDIYLGLHGESMGAGLQIMALARHPKVRFVINDCGYGILTDVLKHKLRQQFHLPAFLVYPAGVMCRIMYGYSFTAVRPIQALEENHIPVCFIHGRDDTFIPCSQSQKMHEATAGYSELHMFPGADHAQSIESDEARYAEIICSFLDKIQGGEKKS